jgi:hypothetical protein
MFAQRILMGLTGLALTAGLAMAGPVRLPAPRPAAMPVSTIAPLSIADLVSGARDAILSYLTIPLGAVPFSDGEKPQE